MNQLTDDRLTSNRDLQVPAVGLGTLGLRESCKESVTTAIAVGCNLIDTGEHYGNLESVGRAMRSISGERPFVVLKLSGIPAGHYETVRERVTSMLQKLGLESAGACLMHWPGMCGWDPTDMKPFLTPSDFKAKASVFSTWEIFCENIALAWENMIRLKDEGLVSEVGTSNFYQHHLEELCRQCPSAIPFANEIFIDSSNQEHDFVVSMQQQGIRVLAYRPLIYRPFPDAVCKLAERIRASPQSVVLGWLLKRGIFPLVKCRGLEHITDSILAPTQVRDLITDSDLVAFREADTGIKLSSEWFAKLWKNHNGSATGAVSEADIQLLVAMGVDEKKARNTLEEHGGNMDMAMDAAFS